MAMPQRVFCQITQSKTTFSKGLAQVFKEEVALIKKCGVGRASSTAHSYFRPPSFRGTDLTRRKCGQTSAPHHLAVRRRGREWLTAITHFYCLALRRKYPWGINRIHRTHISETTCCSTNYRAVRYCLCPLRVFYLTL